MTRYFVLKENEIVGEHGTKMEAEAHWRRLIAWGWPKTRTSSIYSADCRHQLEDHLAKRVQLVSTGVGAGYWDSPEGQEQKRLGDEQEERDCHEEWTSA